MRKRVVIHVMLVMVFLTSCSSTQTEESEDSTEYFVDMAEIAGSLDGERWDFSDGDKGPWCVSLADSYIREVMGFDGTNGTDLIGTVWQAYYRACLNSY